MVAALPSAPRMTYVVAASDSPGPSIRSAMYIADGTADDVQIQSAIDAAESAGGGEVRLMPGSYYIASPVGVPSKVKLVFEFGAVCYAVSGLTANAITRDGESIACVIKNKTGQSHRTAVAASDVSANRSALASGGMLVQNTGSVHIYIYHGDQTGTVGQDKTNAQLIAITGYHRVEPGGVYELPADQTSYTVVCADNESSTVLEYTDSGFEVVNPAIDMSAVTSNTVHYAGILFDGVHNGVVRSPAIIDVLPNPANTAFRQIGVLFIDCHSCRVEGGSIARCGYECIGFRGNNYSCTGVDVFATGGGTHMAQIAGWFHTGGSTYGSGKDNTFNRVNGSGNVQDNQGVNHDGVDIIIHGDVPDGGCAGNRILGCDCGTITLTDSQRDTLVWGNTVRGNIKHSLSNTSAVQRGMRIVSNTIEGDTVLGGYFIDVSGSSVTLEDFEVAHNTARGIVAGRAGSFYFDVSGDNLSAKGFRVHHNTQEILEYGWRMDIASGADGCVIEHVEYCDNNMHFISGGACGGVRCEVAGGSGASPSAIRYLHASRNIVVDAANRQAFVLCITNTDGTVHDVLIEGNYFDDDRGTSPACIAYLDDEVTGLRVYDNTFLGTAVTRVFAGSLTAAVTVDYIGNRADTAPTTIDGTSGGMLTVNSGDWSYA